MERVQPDYYAILEVTPQASNKEIKRAYRRKVKKYHPDLNQKNSPAERKIREINVAYEVLSNPDERKKYDQSRIDRDATLGKTDKQQSAPTAEPPDIQGWYEEWRSHTSEELPTFRLRDLFSAKMWSDAWWPIIKVSAFFLIVGGCLRILKEGGLL